MPTKVSARNFKPFGLLTEGQIEAIHRGALDVLEKTGLRFVSKRALQILEKGGCQVDYEAERARMAPQLVEQCLEQCPRTFAMRASNPEHNVTIDGGSVHFALFAGMRTVDLDTWEPRVPTVEENNDACKIADGLEFVHGSTSYTPYSEFAGEPPAMILPISTWSRLKYFSKISRIGSAVDSYIFELQMAQAIDVDVFGAMESAPPLTYDESASDCGLACAEAGMPVEPGACGIMGGSHPATLSGALVTAMAEVMGGIVLIQLARPGNPVFAHIFPVPQNMRSGLPRLGAISTSLVQVCWNQIWRTLYGIPTMNGGNGASESKQIDFQVGYEKSMGMLLSAISGASWINIIGGLNAELSYHPVQSVLDNDVAGNITRFLEGVQVTDETLAIDLINQVGPVPGFFLDKMHTLKWWRKETFEPHAADTLPYAEWLKGGRKSALDYARERADQLLAEYRPPLTSAQEAQLDGILEEARTYYRGRGMA
jgi:trimethylamine---corrinoid protein Co-methyltransferase